MELTEHDKEILQAVIDGKSITETNGMRHYIERSYEFIFCSLAQEGNLSRYTIKPETIIIGDIEVPKPETERLKDGQRYFVAVPTSKKFNAMSIWQDDNNDLMYLKRGRIHLVEGYAIAHAKAEIKAAGGSYE